MFHEYFNYQEGELLWKESRGRVRKGQIAGRLTQTDYRHVCLNGREHYAHRIV